MQLIIGNKNYSSWSLRPWLLLKQLGIAFEEVKIPLYQDGSKEEILKHSPSGFVPALSHEGLVVWDSLAICEFINDLYPEKQCWPNDPKQRALARSVSAEMHSSFFALRNLLPMNCRQHMGFRAFTPNLQADIARITSIWRDCLAQKTVPGEFLFGAFSIADAMYAPVAIRFQSYGIKVGAAEKAYMENLLALPAMQAWIDEGVAEKEVIAASEISPQTR